MHIYTTLLMTDSSFYRVQRATVVMSDDRPPSSSQHSANTITFLLPAHAQKRCRHFGLPHTSLGHQHQTVKLNND